MEGLVAEDMIEVLRTKITTLSPEQKRLIAINEEDIAFQILSDISVTETGSRIIKLIPIIFHNIQQICIYIYIYLVCR